MTRDIDEDTLDALVPIMILQPLAENAIVHGIGPVTGPGELTLRATQSNGNLVLEVSDTGPGFGVRGAATPPSDEAAKRRNGGENGKRPSGGIGLANTRARLAQLYGDASRFETAASDSGGARVIVTIPFRIAGPSSDTNDPVLVSTASR